MNHCSWPMCEEEGTYPAPRNPRNLSERQYFCAVHIKEFNKRWNGLDGFSENEIYDLQEPAAVWQRQSWSQGAQAATAAPKTPTRKIPARDKEFFRNAQDLYGFFHSRLAREMNGESLPTRRALPADVKAACVIFSIEQPLEDAVLKKRYLSLVKANHPDVNKTPEAAETIKRINVAYKILSDYAARQAPRA